MHYRTPYQGGAIRSWLISKSLQQSGFECEIITRHNHPTYRKQKIDDVVVHFLPVYYENHYGFLKRVFSFWKFNMLSWSLLKSLDTPDLLYAISTPLSTGIIARKYLKKKGVPYVFEVGDLWPEAPVQMGVLKAAWLIRRFRKMEIDTYRAAAGLVAMSPPIASHIQKLCVKANIITIPNLCDLSYFEMGKMEETAFQFFENNRFIICYTGAMGKANGLERMLSEAAWLCERDERVGFVVMGDGSEKERLLKAYGNLENVKFLPFASRDYVKDVLRSSHAVYISYKNIQVLETGSPNKFFDGLAAGKLIITNFGGWISDLIKENKCGIEVDPETPGDLQKKLEPWLADFETDQKVYGARSLKLAEAYRLETKVKELGEWLKGIK